MSNRKLHESNQYEEYNTPIDVVHDLLKLGVLSGVTDILEPCAGSGNVIRAIRQTGFDWPITAVEINNDHTESLYDLGATTVYCADFFDPKLPVDKFDLIILNPPYTQIEPFVSKCYDKHLNPSGLLCGMMRLGHLSGVKRGQFLAKYTPSSVNILCHRPSFRKDGKLLPCDIGGYAWVIWSKPSSWVNLINNQTTLNWIRPSNQGEDKRINNGRKCSPVNCKVRV